MFPPVSNLSFYLDHVLRSSARSCLYGEGRSREVKILAGSFKKSLRQGPKIINSTGGTLHGNFHIENLENHHVGNYSGLFKVICHTGIIKGRYRN